MSIWLRQVPLLKFILLCSYSFDQINLIYMYKRNTRRPIQTPELQKISMGLNKLEQTLAFQDALCGSQNCQCLVCRSKKVHTKNHKISYFDEGSQQSDKWLLKVLNGLCSKDAPGLKMYIPDICFIDGDVLQVFHTDTRENRVKKIQGTIPSKALYLTMLRLKKQYKQMLQQNFQKSILNQINPQFVHQKYYDHVLPSFFNDGEDNIRLQNNKAKFMKYVFHQDNKLLIQSIEEHKLNQNQPFCSVRFTDGNMQLFSKKQFENYTLLRISNDFVYAQSYIKQKQLEKANYTSTYSFLSKQTDIQLFMRAEKEVLILIGDIGKYSDAYENIQVFQDATIQMMKIDINMYIQYMTYKIIHYLAMVSRIYVKHIKLSWVLNDINLVYVQSIFQFQVTQLPLRNIKYRLPPKQENLVFYKDSQNFITLYKQIQLLRQTKRMRVRSILQKELEVGKSNNSTIDQTEASTKQSILKSRLKLQKMSKTVEAERGSMENSPPHFRAKLIEDRYYRQKKQKMPLFQKKRRQRHKSVLDKYMF